MGGAISPTSAGAISESVTLAGSYFSANQMNVQMFVEAVEANQLGTILAKPTVVARSGESADFLVGGEVPIPLVNNLNATNTQFTIIFKKFGVNVEFTPTVLANDRIHLLITPEVSEPDFSFGVRVLGSTVPAFQTRRVNTSVELGDGESFVLGGLIREDILADYENFPFLADVPILGQFFRTRTFQKRQTELVMIVTPHLVKPIEPGVEFELPTDHYIEPSLVEFYWDGRIEGRAPKEEDEGSESAAAGEARRDPNLLPEEALEVAARQQESTGFVGFIGPFGHRLKTPQPVGDVQ
jgi:pilus assembly protein CpaC